jgi:uncharacterized membrane protein
MIRKVFTALLVLFWVAAGVNHFINPEFYVQIMPPYLPWHLPLVYLSGVAEILGGLAVAVPSLRRWAGWFLLLVLLAVFPANIHMALHEVQVGDADMPTWALWARLPFQFLFAAWVYWICLRAHGSQPGPPPSTH